MYIIDMEQELENNRVNGIDIGMAKRILLLYADGSYTPGIYAAGYIVFALTFVRSYVRSLVRSFVRVFVRSLLSVTFVEFTSKFLVKVSLSEYMPGVYSFRLDVCPFVCSFISSFVRSSVRSFVTFRHVRRIYIKVFG